MKYSCYQSEISTMNLKFNIHIINNLRMLYLIVLKQWILFYSLIWLNVLLNLQFIKILLKFVKKNKKKNNIDENLIIMPDI